MDDWRDRLDQGTPDAAWDLFIQRYRRLIFAAIRHYAQDYDDVMDIFARVCEALREDDLRRLRSYMDAPDRRAKFTTWLVAVVRNLTVDWFRHRDGRRRLSTIAGGFSPIRRRIVEHVFLNGNGHVEAFGLICSESPPGPSFREYLFELRATYQTLGATRRGRLIRELVTLPAEPGRMDPDPTESPERRAWLDKALLQLDPEDRVAVQLYVIEELPAADIARMLGLPNAKTVYNRVYRALESLRITFGQAGIGPGDL